MSGRMDDKRMAELRGNETYRLPWIAKELLDALQVERDEVERLEAELADMRTQYELLCDDYRELDADVTAFRARCERQEGDPTVEQVRDIMEIFNAECVTGRVFRVALRAWGEEA